MDLSRATMLGVLDERRAERRIFTDDTRHDGPQTAHRGTVQMDRGTWQFLQTIEALDLP